MDQSTIDTSAFALGSAAWWEQASRYLKINEDDEEEGIEHEELGINSDSARDEKADNDFSTDDLKSDQHGDPGTLLDSTRAAPPKRKPNNKRKRRTIVQDGTSRVDKKRKTITGRPTNKWTPSRSRKLVRLYLMTDLSTEEIRKVLRARDFAPK
jgi:hypothetical protein